MLLNAKRSSGLKLRNFLICNLSLEFRGFRSSERVRRSSERIPRENTESSNREGQREGSQYS